MQKIPFEFACDTWLAFFRSSVWRDKTIKPQIAVASCKLHPTTSVKSAIHINLLCSWKKLDKIYFYSPSAKWFRVKVAVFTFFTQLCVLCASGQIDDVVVAEVNRRVCWVQKITRRSKAMSHQQQLYHEFGVTLHRQRKDEQWGLRLAGGSDLNSPLIVIRVIVSGFSLIFGSNGPFACGEYFFVRETERDIVDSFLHSHARK